MSVNQFIEWGFMALVSGGVGFTMHFLQRLLKSIERLNDQMATIVERTAWHGRELDNLDKRVDHLENKKRGIQ